MAVYMNITFWDVTPWISLGRYHHTGGISNLCTQGRKLIQHCTLMMEQLVPSKCWYLFCKLRDLTSQDSTHRFHRHQILNMLCLCLWKLLTSNHSKHLKISAVNTCYTRGQSVLSIGEKLCNGYFLSQPRHTPMDTELLQLRWATLLTLHAKCNCFHWIILTFRLSVV